MQQQAKMERVLFAGFNQDCSCLAVGSSGGYRVFRMTPFAQVYSVREGGMGHVGLLFESSLVTLVGAGREAAFSPRRFRLFNANTRKYICELDFVSTVRSVLLNKSRLAVVLDDKVHLFDIKTMKVLHALATPRNPLGVADLCSNVKSCYLALPASAGKGEVLLYDALNLQVAGVIQAHQHPLRIVKFNRSGSMLATASTKGTVVRIFRVPTGQRLFQFRRGTYPTKINSLAFSANSVFLALSSATQTIHVFKLAATTSAKSKHSNKPSSSSATSSASSSYLSDDDGDSSAVYDEDDVKHGEPRIVISSANSSNINSKGKNNNNNNSNSSSSSNNNNSSSSTAAAAASTAATTVAAGVGAAASTIGKGAASVAASAMTTLTSLLPNMMQDVVESDRSFATISLRDTASNAIVGFDRKDDHTLIVATTAGHCLVYTIPPGGGVCKLKSEHSLMPTDTEQLGVKIN